MKSKKTKRALISSVLALVLCFVMLLGTTFAWFTDTASTNVNKIQAGTLKIELLDKDGEELKEALKWQKAEDAPENEKVLWEPGATYNLEPVTIKNNGTLALKYKIEISGIDGDAELNDVIEWTVEVDDDVRSIGSEFHLGTSDTDNSDILTISGHMKEDAGNTYQGLSIDGVAITVYATQDTVEYDSSTNQYDKDATYNVIPVAPTKDEDGVYHITSAAEFVDFITKLNTDTYHNVSVVLDADIDLGGTKIARTGKYYSYANFDGKGHTVSNFTLEAHDDETGFSFASLFGAIDGQVTIKNLTVRDADIKGDAWVGVIAGASYNGEIENCKVYDCTVSGVKKVGTIVGYLQGKSVTSCYAEDCTVIYSEKQGGEIIGYADENATATNNTATDVTVSQLVASGVMLNNGVYEISSAEGMFWFMNLGTNGQHNKNIKLTADIDLKNQAWTPICDSHTQYSGTFDGNGHTIYNLKVTAPADAGKEEAVGLFAWSNGTIKNLTIDGATISGNHYAGALVGYMQTGTVENCHVKNAEVVSSHMDDNKCGDKAGALIGYTNCSPAYNVYCTVENCSATNCNVTAARDAAQLIGYGYDANTYTALSATNVIVTADTTGCTTHERAGTVSTNALVGNGTEAGLTLSNT